MGYNIVLAQTHLSVCLVDLLAVIAYTYAALELKGLLQAVCSIFQGKAEGLSPADTENTCLKFKPTPEEEISLHKTYMALYT